MEAGKKYSEVEKIRERSVREEDSKSRSGRSLCSSGIGRFVVRIGY